jgi:hypothetical protein
MAVFLNLSAAIDPILSTNQGSSARESSVSLKPVTNIRRCKNLLYKDNFIFISERFMCATIATRNLANPINKGYIAIPAALIWLLKNDILCRIPLLI